jgi:c-di-AMP phosphodiesterase-like protein
MMSQETIGKIKKFLLRYIICFLIIFTIITIIKGLGISKNITLVQGISLSVFFGLILTFKTLKSKDRQTNKS